MTEKSFHFVDDQAAIEHALLRNDIQDLVSQRATLLGVRMTSEFEYGLDKPGTKIVLQSEPSHNMVITDDDDDVDSKRILQLWAQPTTTDFLGEVTLSFLDPETYIQANQYTSTPSSLAYYDRAGEDAEIDRDEIADLRLLLQETTWDPQASIDAGQNAHFWDD